MKWMKCVLSGLLLALCLAGCGGAGSAVDYGETDEADSAEQGVVLTENADYFDLSAEKLTAAAEELPEYLLFTNSMKITVKTADKNADCTVHLCADGADLLEFDLKGREKEAFTNLTAARLYSLRIDNADGVTFTVTD